MRARVFSIAFAVVAVAGLAVSVVIPLTVPGPKWLTVALGSSVLVLVSCSAASCCGGS